MNTHVPLSSLLHVLPDAMVGQIKDHGVDVDDPETVVRRKSAVDVYCKAHDLKEKEVLQYVSTRDVDRDMEILNPAGCVLTEFKKAPQVLWGHDYSIPPIGSDRLIEKDSRGVRAITRYADTPLANDLWSLRRDGHLNTSSVGFIPLKYVRNGGDGWKTLTTKLAGDWGVDVSTFEKADAILDKWLLLEHSDVSVPANINARTIAVGKGMEAQELELLCTKGEITTPDIVERLKAKSKIFRIEWEAESKKAVEVERKIEVVPQRRFIQIETEPPRDVERVRIVVMQLQGRLE